MPAETTDRLAGRDKELEAAGYRTCFVPPHERPHTLAKWQKRVCSPEGLTLYFTMVAVFDLSAHLAQGAPPLSWTADWTIYSALPQWLAEVDADSVDGFYMELPLRKSWTVAALDAFGTEIYARLMGVPDPYNQR